jgi:hypothetical protein
LFTRIIFGAEYMSWRFMQPPSVLCSSSPYVQISSSKPYSQTSQPMFLPHCERPVFTTI